MRKVTDYSGLSYHGLWGLGLVRLDKLDVRMLNKLKYLNKELSKRNSKIIECHYVSKEKNRSRKEGLTNRSGLLL